MRTHCVRCEREVLAEYRNPRARKLAKGYLLVWIPIIPILPIMASDYVVSLPLLMLYMLGTGPVLALIQDPPTCTDCGANVKPPGKARRGSAPVPPPAG